jgi:hypothetical protein
MLFDKTKTLTSKQLVDKAVAGANKILSQRTIVLEAIRKAVTELDPLIASRLAAEASAAAAAADAILAGSETAGDGGDTAIGHAIKAIESQAIKLRGLRKRAIEQGVELVTADQELAASLPAYESDIRESFRGEYVAAIGALEKILVRRQAIEAATGRLELPPVPQFAAGGADPVLSELAPHKTRAALRNALADIAGWDGLVARSSGPEGAALPIRTFDPTGVYELRSPQFGFEAGARLVTCSLNDGILEWLCSIGDAVPVREESPALSVVREANRKIAADTSRPELEPGIPFPAEVLERSREAQRINERDAMRANPDKATHVRMAG